jgi:hypothetical protein
MSEVSRNPSVAIVGSEGVVGTAYQQLFPDAIRYDEPKHVYFEGNRQIPNKALGRLAVNSCDMAIVSVFTPSKENGELDTSIVEEVVEWIDTPLILIKSALQPGTVDKLVEKTGKNIAVSCGIYRRRQLSSSLLEVPRSARSEKTHYVNRWW